MAQRMDTADTPSVNDQASKESPMGEKPTCVVCLGMAGSGKTTFMQVRSSNCGFVLYLSIFYRESVLTFTLRIAHHIALTLIQQLTKYHFLLILVCVCVCAYVRPCVCSSSV